MMLIKLGGGLIAPKHLAEETADVETIRRLARELGQMWEAGQRFVVINGSGNFGHSWAKKYDIQHGFERNDEKKRWGAARTQFSASLINKIVVEHLLSVGLPAVSVAPHDLKSFVLVGELSAMGLVPVLYGDVIWDESKGCVIFSGEAIISKIVETGLSVQKIIQVSIEKGVWDEEKKIISEINGKNWEHYKKSILGSAGVDVTGGMLHKVEVSLAIADAYKIPTYITHDLVNFEEGTKISF